MVSRFGRILAYAKLWSAIVLVVLIVIVVFANYGYETDVWLFRKFENVPTLLLIAVTAGVSIVSFWVLLRVRRLIADVRRIRDDQRREETLAQQRSVADELAEREKRLDEKLRNATRSAPESTDKDRPPAAP
jgi:type VI protein secretion system component VasK